MFLEVLRIQLQFDAGEWRRNLCQDLGSSRKISQFVLGQTHEKSENLFLNYPFPGQNFSLQLLTDP